MKLTTKIRDIGHSKGILLPAIWFKEVGQIKEVGMEISGSIITIAPIAVIPLREMSPAPGPQVSKPTELITAEPVTPLVEIKTPKNIVANPIILSGITKSLCPKCNNVLGKHGDYVHCPHCNFDGTITSKGILPR